MFDVFGSLRSLFKVDTTCIDNNVFRLHYKATVIVLVACSLIVTSRQYIGDPISCIIPDGIPDKVVNQYCWIHGTFSVVDAFSMKVGEQVPYPGVMNSQNTQGKERVYHSYYQWVCFMLFFQAALFYVPRYIWKVSEGGKMKALNLGLDNPIISEGSKNEKKKLLSEYLANNMHEHTLYVAVFIVCEVLNFINVVGQIYFMDLFLGGEFTTYGPSVIQYSNMDQEDRIDPMITVFPRLTKCTFHAFGASGDVQRFDSLCVLPLNIVNEKVYIFLWFWFVLLAICTGLCLVYRIIIVVWPKARLYAIRSKARLVPIDYLEIVVRKMKLGDWFVLDLISKNMTPLIFREFVVDLARKIEGKEML